MEILAIQYHGVAFEAKKLPKQIITFLLKIYVCNLI